MESKNVLLLFLGLGIVAYIIVTITNRNTNVVTKKQSPTKKDKSILVVVHTYGKTQTVSDIILSCYKSALKPDRVFFGVYVDTFGIDTIDLFYYISKKFKYRNNIRVISNNTKAKKSKGALHGYFKLLDNEYYTCIIGLGTKLFKKKWDMDVGRNITYCANWRFPCVNPISMDPNYINIPSIAGRVAKTGGFITPTVCTDFLSCKTSLLKKSLKKNIISNYTPSYTRFCVELCATSGYILFP